MQKKCTARDIVLSNKKVALTLSTKGGTVTKAVVKNYKDNVTGKNEVTLFTPKDQNLNYVFEAKEANISTADLYFVPSNVTDSTLTLTSTAAPGKIRPGMTTTGASAFHLSIPVCRLSGPGCGHNPSMLREIVDSAQLGGLLLVLHLFIQLPLVISAHPESILFDFHNPVQNHCAICSSIKNNVPFF